MKLYKVIIIGAGNIGAFFDTPASNRVLTHAHAFYHHKNFRLVGFYDVDYEKAKLAAKLWNCQAFAALDAAMEEAEVVCCTVSDTYHYEVLKKIANYSVKLVFTEKPLTKTIEEAQEIAELYQEKKLPIQVNYTRRFLTEFRQLKERICDYGRFLKGTGYYGKGILHNGSHMLDLITNLLGEIKQFSGKNKLYDCYLDDPSVEVELKVKEGVILLQPIDCRIATIFELELFFEKARIRIINSGFQIEIYEVNPSPLFEGYFNYRKTKEIEVNYDNGFENAVQNIYEVLEKKAEILSTVSNAKHILEICCKLQ